MSSSEMLTKGERTRQVVLDAAYSLIIEQGYAATSMRQIAEKSNLALGSIYNHFSSKEEVFKAIINERHPFIQMIPLLNAVKARTISEFVTNTAHALVDEFGHHSEVLNLMLTEIVEFKGQHVPMLFEKMLPMLLPSGERISKLEGTVRQIPPLILVRAFLGMFFSYYITDVLMGPVMPPEMRADALDHFVEIFLNGVLLS